MLDKLDARHWSERQLVLLCMQTSDTSIDLYWKDGMLRSRHGIGPASGGCRSLPAAFGYPGLHVMDGSVMPASPGVNPTLMITALAERAVSLWPPQGRHRSARRARLPSNQGGHAAQAHRPEGRTGRAAPSCKAGQGHLAVSLLTGTAPINRGEPE